MSSAKPLIQDLLFQSATNQSSSASPDAVGASDTPSVEFNITAQKHLALINRLDKELAAHFADKLSVHRSLTRQLVSFQANKQRPAYRWYKYKEAFSAPLIDLLFSRYDVNKGVILDPFAGAGTALFVAADSGLSAHGIELLPIGQEIIRTRLLIRELQPKHFKRLKLWLDSSMWKEHERTVRLSSLRITDDAYPRSTLHQIERYMSALLNEPEEVKSVLRFALLCVLENVSYTRKDGQYLRWDYRSGRRQGVKQFDKGEILRFEPAIHRKISEILNDLSSGSVPLDLFSKRRTQGKIKLLSGSCLDVLPTLKANQYKAVITSPPYCNRYDYTRTYALELALLGVGETEIGALRQQMLSCTVENRAKDLVAINPAWATPVEKADRHPLLQAILAYLEWCREVSLLNNNGIARMVRGYFYEMACVIAECYRVLKPGAVLIMVNDNVRYAGASVSVDLILSSLAESLGFIVDTILVLPDGKGNSSQQMGAHGRDVLRKCVYVWRKDNCHTVST